MIVRGGWWKRPAALPASFLPVMALLVLILAAAPACRLLNGREEEIQLYRFHRLMMDTNVELVFSAAGSREAAGAQEAAFMEMARLEALLSRSLQESDILRLNRRAGAGSPAAVSPETITVVESALEYSALTGGAFDITVAPLLDLWGFLGRQFRVPAQEEIESALPLVDYTLLRVDRERGELYLPRAGMAVDLGGIAKGYIVDRGLEILAEAGIKHAFLNAGGDIALLGSRPDGTPWRIGVQHPREKEKLLAVLSLTGGAVVTSGDYERAFQADGRRYHHILDPETGFPVYSLASVTVIAPTAMTADALSTAIFVLGPERGLALVEKLPGIEALLVTPELELLISSGLQGKVELL